MLSHRAHQRVLRTQEPGTQVVAFIARSDLRSIARLCVLCPPVGGADYDATQYG